MATLISSNLPSLSSTLLSPLRFNPISLKNSTFFSSSPIWSRKTVAIAVCCSVSSASDSIPSNYGGWDDLELVDSFNSLGKLDPVSSFLVSIGIRDGKHGLLFLLGFLSALAVSRVRVSTMAVLPVAVLVFVVGFTAGMAKEGIGSNGSGFMDSDKKLKELRTILNEMDVKITHLRNGLEGMVNFDHFEKSKIKKFVEFADYVRMKLGYASKIVGDSNSGDALDEIVVSGREGGKKSKQKLSWKSEEIGEVAYDLVKYLGGIIQENFAELGSPQRKDTIKEEVGVRTGLMTEESVVSGNAIVEQAAGNDRASNPLPVESLKSSNAESSGNLGVNAPDNVKTGKAIADSTRSGVNEKSSRSRDSRCIDDMLLYDGEIRNQNTSFHYMRKQGSLERMVFKHKFGHTMQNGAHDFADSGNNLRRTKAAKGMDFFKESEESSLLEQTLEIQNRSYLEFHGNSMNTLKIEQKGATNFDGMKVKSKDQFGEQTAHDNLKEEGNMPSSSTVSGDEEFSRNVKEASELLRRAGDCMISKADEEKADVLLHKSARLLSTAVALKPTSLLAIGQLGNTYLLHGELKLKISRELRTLLSRRDAYLEVKEHDLRFKKMDRRILSRDNLSTALIDVCEECEELLVEAGRKYRMALSIDRNDVKALYNWGLALSFRAQLIADIGPEAALDADKVYMAAIDKFDAMLSRNNTYAPEALYRWGIALQRRSRLRSPNNKEKIKLLQQAKSLFEDVLYMETDNQMVREALSSCLVELNYNGLW
ncbi:uncharacterized protein [Typha angustifolia]|uniref:uncharacterized protein n=1 Tax=Typha angustifolia TaxID=59011 RepID=UPI003C2EEF24